MASYITTVLLNTVFESLKNFLAVHLLGIFFILFCWYYYVNLKEYNPEIIRLYTYYRFIDLINPWAEPKIWIDYHNCSIIQLSLYHFCFFKLLKVKFNKEDLESLSLKEYSINWKELIFFNPTRKPMEVNHYLTFKIRDLEKLVTNLDWDSCIENIRLKDHTRSLKLIVLKKIKKIIIEEIEKKGFKVIFYNYYLENLPRKIELIKQAKEKRMEQEVNKKYVLDGYFSNIPSTKMETDLAVLKNKFNNIEPFILSINQKISEINNFLGIH